MVRVVFGRGCYFWASMKALPKRKGNTPIPTLGVTMNDCLNESPSKKEGKSPCGCAGTAALNASMKALPKRKGNFSGWIGSFHRSCASMKALPKRKGNLKGIFLAVFLGASMKALPKRKGNLICHLGELLGEVASMKALPKRKGNNMAHHEGRSIKFGLNESPSKKEGKSRFWPGVVA